MPGSFDAKSTRRLLAIFEDVCDLPAAARDAALAEACGNDHVLRTRVERLLDEDRGSPCREAVSSWDELRAAVHHIAADGPTSPSSQVFPSFLGAYRLIRKIGEGGMGVVYEAEQPSLARHVALKVIRGGWLTPGGVRRFRRETDALGRLDHPGIARIFEAGTTQSNGQPLPYFAMELVHGEAIDRYVTSHALRPVEIVRQMIEICRTIDYAHQRGVIHRDLKPANILVDADGHTKIIDFGVAVARPGPGEQPQTTATLAPFAGTLAYTSPEQVSGVGDGGDARSDIYALGMVLFELLAGRPAFDLAGRGLLDALRAIRDDEVPRLRTLAPGIPADLEAIVAKATEKPRERRYQSAHEFADDLQRYVDDVPVAARVGGTWYGLWKLARRNRKAVIAAAAVLVALLAGATATTIAWQAARKEKALRSEQYSAARQAFTDLVRQITKGEESAVQVGFRRQLLDAMLRHIEDLCRADPSNAGLTALRAEALVRLGSAQREAGDFRGARVSQESALAIRQELASGGTPEVAARRDLAESEVKLGDLDKETGAIMDAFAQYEHALALHERLASEHPDDLAVIDDLAWSHERIGALCMTLGDLRAADRHFELRRGLVDRLARERPTQAEAVHAQFTSAEYRAGLCDLLGETEEARRLRHEALAHAQRMLEMKPDYPSFVHAADSVRAQLFGRDSRPESRIAPRDPIDQALVHAERLQREDPINPYLATMLGSALRDAAMRDEAEGLWARARQHVTRANDVLRSALSIAPENVEVMHAAMTTRLHLAAIEKQAGNSEAARALDEEGRTLATRLASICPSPPIIAEVAALMLDPRVTAPADPRSVIRMITQSPPGRRRPGFHLLMLLRRLHGQTGDRAAVAEDERALLEVIPERDTPLRRELQSAAR